MTARRSSSPRRKSTARKSSSGKRPATGVPVPVTAPTGQLLFLLNVPYEARHLVGSMGAKYDKARRCWVYVGTGLPPSLSPYAAAQFSWEAWQQNKINGTPQTALPGTGDITLRPHQQLATDLIVANHAEARSGFLVADDVGLGKTYSAIDAVHRLPDVENVLVICPKSVKASWRKSLKLYGTGDKNWCVNNVDGLKKMLSIPQAAANAKQTKTRNKHIAASGRPLERFDVVIFDESHAYRNPVSQRSAAARTLSARSFCIWMSATAGQNPLELSYLAPVLAEVSGHKVDDLEQFAAWCTTVGIGVKQGDYGKWEWEPNPDDLVLINRLLFSDDNEDGLPVGIRRVPADIAGWPEQQRLLTPIELDPDGQRLYAELWTDFRSEMKMARRGKNPAGGLAALTRFRQKASLLRVNGVAGLVEELLDNGTQVAVSVFWHESMHELADALNVDVATIHGQQSEAERESNRQAFQTGKCPVVLFTPTEGFSLHATEDIANGVPRATVIHDPRWTALELHQACGRTHRDGERADAYFTYAEGTVEEIVMRRALERVSSMGRMQGDDVDAIEDMIAAMDDFAGPDD